MERNRHSVEVIPLRLDAAAIAVIGLPKDATPLVEATPEGLQVAIAGLSGPQLDFVLDLGPQQPELLGAVYTALEHFTGLHAVKRFVLHPRAASKTTALLRLTHPELEEIFGTDAWHAYEKRAASPARAHGSGHSGPRNAHTAERPSYGTARTSTASAHHGGELSASEAARVSAWFARNQVPPPHPIERAILAQIEEIEGDPQLASAMRQLLHQGAARQRALDAVALRDLIARARVEVERARLGIGSFSLERRNEMAVGGKPHQVDALETAEVPARIVEHGLVVSGRPTRFEVALDWSAYRGSSDPEFAGRDWHAVVDWVFERADAQGPTLRGGGPVEKPEHVQTGVALDHSFQLAPGEQSGTWTVHAFVYTSHFAPRHVTAAIQVKTEDARMADLRHAAFAGMEPANGKTSPHRFGLGIANAVLSSIHLHGEDHDADGTMTTGDLPESFQARSPAVRAENRQQEVTRTEQLVDYLKRLADPRYAEALGAAQRRLAQLREVDKEIKRDEAAGWQSFELRGTYLGRQPEVASGPLDLYGSVRHDPLPMMGGDPVHVQIRDHSERLGPQTPTYSGFGNTFEDALESAVVELAKDYPEGKVSVLAEGMDASTSTARTTRKAIGFELPTTSSVKRLKDRIYNPVVQTVVNIAATALMIFQPELAPLIMPVLTVNNTVRNLDDVVHAYETKTLTAGQLGLTVAQIGLDFLPYVGSAKILSTPARLVAFEAANQVGMVTVMAFQTRDAIAEIQERDIAALADKYQQLIDQQKSTNPSDPELAHQQDLIAQKQLVDEGAARIRARVQQQWLDAIAQNGAFMVGSHVLGDIQRTRVAAEPAAPEGGWADAPPARSSGDDDPPREEARERAGAQGAAAEASGEPAASHEPAPAGAAHDEHGAAPTRPASHDTARTTPNESFSPARETTAAAIAGSSFKGGARPHGAANAAEIVDRARASIGDTVARFGGATASAVPAAHHTDARERAIINATYLVTMPAGEAFTIRITSGPIGSDAVARTIVNPSKQGQTFVHQTGAQAPHAVDVEGRYVIQLNDTIDPANVDRALAHEVAEILEERDLAAKKQNAGPDVLRPGSSPPPHAVLSPHDHGRIAEIRVVLDKLAQHDPSAPRELTALIEELGIREGTPGAAERRRLVFGELHDEAATHKLAELAQGEANLAPEAKAQLESVKTARETDLAASEAQQAARRPIHDLPDAAPEPGKLVSPERAEQLAHEAKTRRDGESAATVADLRGKASRMPPGEYPTIKRLQVGGGASLAARDPSALLVDAAGRWQADGGGFLAQTANQMRGLKDAGIGDPFQFAKPDERVPMAAVRYWQDSIAAQGPVINGKVTGIAVDEAGRTIATIEPSDGGPPLKLQVEGDLTLATGFPTERIPGTPRGMSPDKGIAKIQEALRALAADERDPARKAKAQAALDQIEHVAGHEGEPGQREQDLAAVRKALRDNDLEATIAGSAKDAYDMVVAGDQWERLRREHPDKFVLGDDANLKTLDASKTDKWVVGGSSGTGISAAEIILDRNTNAHVTMVGDKPPAGLLENDQFRKVVAQHGDAQTVALYKQLGGAELPPGDGRFSLVLDVAVGTPELAGNGTVEVHGKRSGGSHDGEPLTGDFVPDGYDAGTNPLANAGAYVAAIGRDGQLPPVAAELKRSVEAAGGSMTMELIWDQQGQYAGYRLKALDKDERVIRTLDVTGAASQSPPWGLMSVEERRKNEPRFWAAADLDAPPESGNFDGGYAASAERAARLAREQRSARERGAQ